MVSPVPKKSFSRGGWRHEPPLKMVAFVGAGYGLTRFYKSIFRGGWRHSPPYKWFNAKKKFITFLYDLGWCQSLYQNCRELRDLKLCSWQIFHLRLSNVSKNYYKFSNSYNYIVSHITQVIIWSFHNLNLYIHWNILSIFFMFLLFTITIVYKFHIFNLICYM